MTRYFLNLLAHLTKKQTDTQIIYIYGAAYRCYDKKHIAVPAR